MSSGPAPQTGVRRLMRGLTTVVVALAVVAGVTAAPAAANTYREFFDSVDWLADKYGAGTVYVGHEPMEEGSYAWSSGRTIMLNSYYIDNPEQLWVDLNRDVMHGFHPGRMCTPAELVAAHEFAHVLDYLSGYSARTELEYAIVNGLSGEVSGYSFNSDGTVNHGEALADAFLAVECDEPTNAELALYEMLTT